MLFLSSIDCTRALERGEAVADGRLRLQASCKLHEGPAQRPSTIRVTQHYEVWSHAYGAPGPILAVSLLCTEYALGAG